MEGSYNKVFLSKGNVPSASYNFFMDILLRTIRDEIASCMEAAYKRILFTEAGNMLYFRTPEELTTFAKEVNTWLNLQSLGSELSFNSLFPLFFKRKWNLSADNFFYFQQKTASEQENVVPAEDLVSLMVDYAKELEIIV